ncbi:MAG: hypothetical protein ACKVOI_16730 [Dongiaceae bacterium]
MIEETGHGVSGHKRMTAPAQSDAGMEANAGSAAAETKAAVDLLADRTAIAALLLTDPALERYPAIWQQAGALFRQGLKELDPGDVFQNLIAAQIVAMNGALMSCLARAQQAGDRSRAKKTELRLALLLLRTLIQHTRALDKSARGRPQRRDRGTGLPESGTALEVI